MSSQVCHPQLGEVQPEGREEGQIFTAAAWQAKAMLLAVAGRQCAAQQRVREARGAWHVCLFSEEAQPVSPLAPVCPAGTGKVLSGAESAGEAFEKKALFHYISSCFTTCLVFCPGLPMPHATPPHAVLLFQPCRAYCSSKQMRGIHVEHTE